MLPLLASACGGGLGHRSVGAMGGELRLPDGIASVRIELEDCRLAVRPPAEAGAPTLRYDGELRRGADTEAGLAELEALSAALTGARDPADPACYVVRGPERPAGMAGAILGVEVAIELPAELALEVVVSGSGNLTVEERLADVTLAAGRGDLRVTGCRGDADLHTGRGMTIVYDHCGDLQVDVGVGDMQVFLREPGEQVRLATGRGNIQCLIPQQTGFRLDARAETGKVANGFSIATERKGYHSVMVGQRGDGRTEIVMRTRSGHLSLSYKDWH